MQDKSWAWPLLGWAIWCVPTFQIPVLLWMSSWLQSTVENPCKPGLWTLTSWLYFYIHLSPIHKRHWQDVRDCKENTMLWRQVHGLAEFSIYLFLPLQCYCVDPKLEHDFCRPCVLFCILLCLWHCGNYKGTPIFDLHFIKHAYF